MRNAGLEPIPITPPRPRTEAHCTRSHPMPDFRLLRRFAAALLLLAVTAAAATPAAAQQSYTIRGTVVDATSQRPLGNVSVVLQGTGLQTLTTG